MKFLASVLALATLVASASAQCNINAVAGLQNNTCNGNRYVVSAPSECVDGGCGVIFDVHGFTMSTEQQNSGTQMRERGNQAGYIVVHPQASGLLLPSWSERDDRNVLQSVIDISETFNADKDRIHFGGFSQGGWMTWRMICNTMNLSPHPRDIIASFGPIAAGLGGEVPSCFSPNMVGGPTSIFHIHGRNDYAVFFREALRAAQDVESAQRTDSSFSKETLFEDDFQERIRQTGAGIIYESLWHTSTHCMVFPGGSGLYNCNGPFATGEEQLKFYQNNPRRTA